MIIIDIAPTGRAICVKCGEKINKGDPRLCATLGKCCYKCVLELIKEFKMLMKRCKKTIIINALSE